MHTEIKLTGKRYNINILLELDAKYCDSEYDNIDTGVGLSSVRTMSGSTIIEGILSARIVSVEKASGGTRDFDITLSNEFIDKNYDMLKELAYEKI